LRSCSSLSSPSSSGAVSGSNGFEFVSNGWYSLAIKPEKMRNPRGKRKRENRGKNQEKKTEPGSETGRNRTRENFGPSTSSTSCFYHHCLRLRGRRSDRELEKGTNRRRGSNTGNTTRRAKTERKRSRHRGEKTNTKGRK